MVTEYACQIVLINSIAAILTINVSISVFFTASVFSIIRLNVQFRSVNFVTDTITITVLTISMIIMIIISSAYCRWNRLKAMPSVPPRKFNVRLSTLAKAIHSNRSSKFMKKTKYQTTVRFGRKFTTKLKPTKNLTKRKVTAKKFGFVSKVAKIITRVKSLPSVKVPRWSSKRTTSKKITKVSTKRARLTLTPMRFKPTRRLLTERKATSSTRRKMTTTDFKKIKGFLKAYGKKRQNIGRSLEHKNVQARPEGLTTTSTILLKIANKTINTMTTTSTSSAIVTSDHAIDAELSRLPQIRHAGANRHIISGLLNPNLAGIEMDLPVTVINQIVVVAPTTEATNFESVDEGNMIPIKALIPSFARLTVAINAENKDIPMFYDEFNLVTRSKPPSHDSARMIMIGTVATLTGLLVFITAILCCIALL